MVQLKSLLMQSIIQVCYYFWTWLTFWLAVNLTDYFSIYLPPIIFGHTNHLMLAAPARFYIILTLLCNILITTYLGWFFYEFEWFTYLLSQAETISTTMLTFDTFDHSWWRVCGGFHKLMARCLNLVWVMLSSYIGGCQINGNKTSSHTWRIFILLPTFFKAGLPKPESIISNQMLTNIICHRYGYPCM